MKSTRLLFYINAAYPLFARSDHGFGGAEINLYYISKEFSRRGYSVEFLVGDYGQDEVELYNSVLLRKIKYFGLEKYTGLKHKILRRFNFLKLLWTSDADIYISSAAGEMDGYMTAVARLREKKTIFRIASDFDVDNSFSKLKYLLGFMYRYALPTFDEIVVQNKSQKKMLLENNNLNGRFIGNGFPLSANNNEYSKNVVLWVGRDNPVKRPLLFLELARELGDTKCIMIMQGSGLLKDTVKSEVNKISNITLIDHVDFFEIQSYFETAVCLVNTSEKEGFSNTFIQACIASTPILSYNVDPDNIITNNSMGLLCNNSVESATKFINSLDDEMIKIYGSNAFNYVKENHDLQDKVDQYESLIKDLV